MFVLRHLGQTGVLDKRIVTEGSGRHGPVGLLRDAVGMLVIRVLWVNCVGVAWVLSPDSYPGIVSATYEVSNSDF